MLCPKSIPIHFIPCVRGGKRLQGRYIIPRCARKAQVKACLIAAFRLAWAVFWRRLSIPRIRGGEPLVLPCDDLFPAYAGASGYKAAQKAGLWPRLTIPRMRGGKPVKSCLLFLAVRGRRNEKVCLIAAFLPLGFWLAPTIPRVRGGEPCQMSR